MDDPGATLQEHVGVLLDLVARVPGGVAGLTAAGDGDLLDLVPAAARVVRCAEGVLAGVAGEVSRRSAGSGDSSFARKQGYRSARGLIAAKAALSFGTASRVVEVGEAIRPGVALSGEDLPAEREHLAAAVLSGEISLSIAQLIDLTVEKVEHRLLRNQADDLERGLVAEFLTGAYSPAQFTAHCAEMVEVLDPDGTQPRDENLRKQSSITETWLPNGMLRIVAELDPEAAAFYRAAVRARTNPRRPARPEPSEEGGNGNDPQPSEPTEPTAATGSGAGTQPTPMESKVQAFIGIMRDALKHEDGPQAGVDTTILVRIDLDALVSGLGSATIDGVPKPVPAAAARRLAAEADLIPQVLDGRSRLLDQGESKRVFTKAQRYAILAGFVGCAFPCCDIPSSMVEFHHIGRWASRSDHRHGTDLANGIPLCGFHNRLMEQGWDVELDEDGVPWFTPPPHVDWAQRRIRGGNLARRPAA